MTCSACNKLSYIYTNCISCNKHFCNNCVYTWESAGRSICKSCNSKNCIPPISDCSIFPFERAHTDAILSEIAEIKKDIQAIKNMLQEAIQRKPQLACVCGNNAQQNCLACDKPVCRPCIDGYNTTGVVCKECARCPTGY